MPYLILYYEVSLKMTNYVFIMAPAIILASVVTAFWGKVYDRRGYRFSGIIALMDKTSKSKTAIVGNGVARAVIFRTRNASKDE